MTAAHAVLGAVAVALFATAGMLGAWRWWRVEPSPWFWRVLRAAQAVLLVEVALGGALLLSDRRPGDDLHYVYGLTPLLVSFAAEGLRAVAAATVLEARGLPDARAVGKLEPREQRSVVAAIVRREIGVMAAGALVVTGLLARAALG